MKKTTLVFVGFVSLLLVAELMVTAKAQASQEVVIGLGIDSYGHVIFRQVGGYNVSPSTLSIAANYIYENYGLQIGEYTVEGYTYQVVYTRIHGRIADYVEGYYPDGSGAYVEPYSSALRHHAPYDGGLAYVDHGGFYDGFHGGFHGHTFHGGGFHGGGFHGGGFHGGGFHGGGFHGGGFHGGHAGGHH